MNWNELTGVGRVELESGKFCFIVTESFFDAELGGYVPAVVVENEAGYAPLVGNGDHALPWSWGPSFLDAQKTCDEMNRRLGLSDRRVAEIVASSLRGSRR